MSRPEPPFDRELERLATAELEIAGRIAESSNITLVVEFGAGDDYAWAIYKPEAGERPLFDFPPGLYARECAAFLLSEWLGWHIVPPTVVRHDAPVGVGSVQWYVENDGEHYFTLADDPDLHDQLRRIAVFDALTNNTDRKSGHVLRDAVGHIWGIDHGLCFGVEAKLRTVIWEFAGDRIDDELIDAIAPLVDEVPDDVAALLAPDEVAMLQRRASRLTRIPFLPHQTSQWQYPWPLV